MFAGRVSTLCWFSVGPCLRRCPGTAPTLGRSWCLLGFTILCNNVDFWLFRSAYVFFYYIHFGVAYKPKWAGYYIVNIFILSLDLFVHVTIIKIYNTIQYMTRTVVLLNLSGAGVVVMKSCCQQSRRSRVRPPLWHSGLLERNVSSPLTSKDSVSWRASVTET